LGVPLRLPAKFLHHGIGRFAQPLAWLRRCRIERSGHLAVAVRAERFRYAPLASIDISPVFVRPATAMT